MQWSILRKLLNFLRYSFKSTTTNTFKTKPSTNKGITSPDSKTWCRPNYLRKFLTKETKDIIVGTSLGGTVILQRMVIAVDNGVVKTNNSTLMKQCGGSLS